MKTAKEFFESQLITDASSVIDKNAHKFSRHDLINFAEAYASQREASDEEIKKAARCYAEKYGGDLFGEYYRSYCTGAKAYRDGKIKPAEGEKYKAMIDDELKYGNSAFE